MRRGIAVLAVVLLAVALSSLLIAYAQNPSEVRIEVEKAASMASKTVISVDEAIRVFRRLASCDPAVRPAALTAIEALRGGFTPSLYIYYKIFLTPKGLRNCTASLVYKLLLLAASTRVGPVLAPNNVPFVRGLVLEALGYNSSMNWLLAANLTPEAWAALGALVYAGRVDPGYWKLVSRDRLAVCTALLVADSTALDSLLSSGSPVLRLLPPRSHPYTAALWASKSTLCTRGLTRLYIHWLEEHGVEPPYPKLGSCSGRVGHVIVWNLLHESRVCIDGTVYPDVLREALSSRASRWQLYEAHCECSQVRMWVGASGEPGAWITLCSRDPLLSRLLGWSGGRLVELDWSLWGGRLATRRVTEEYIRLLEREAGFESPVEALRYCASFAPGSRLHEQPPRSKTLAGLIARLASIRVYNGSLVSDQIVVRMCAFLLLRSMGDRVDTSIFYAPPIDPLDAWVAGYLWTTRPPRDTRLLREALLAWRLSVLEGAERLTPALERLAESLAEGDYRGALNASRSLLHALGIQLNETILSPGLLRLAARLASLERGAGGVEVNLTKAALLYSKIANIPLDEAERLVSGNIGEVLQGLLDAGLNRTLARSIIESLPVPRRVAGSLERLVEEASRNPVAYAKLAALIRSYAGFKAPTPPPPPPLRLPGAPPVGLVAAAAAALAAGYIGYRVASLYSRLPRDEVKRRMLILLRLLEARTGVRRAEWETLREYASRLPGRYRGLLLGILPGYERVRYGGAEEPGLRERLSKAVRRLLRPWSGGSS